MEYHWSVAQRVAFIIAAWLIDYTRLMSIKSLKGHLLLATKMLVDPNFARSVVLIFDHSDDGAAGVILNRPVKKTIADIAEEVFNIQSDWQKPLHLGGPVSGPLAAAHTIKEMADMEVMPGIYGSLAPEHLQKLIKKRQEPTLFLVNYAGWGPGQLEDEIDEDAWLVMPARTEHLFWTKDQDLWEACIAEASVSTMDTALGIRIKPRDPRMN